MNIDYKNISDKELLSMIIRDAKLAGTLYSQFGSLRDIVMDASAYELSQVYGVGERRILQIQALKELNKRIYRPDPVTKYKITSPQSIYDLVFTDVAYREVKCFGTIILDTKLQVIKNEIVSIGSTGIALLDQRLVFTTAIRKNAARVAIYTNGTAGSCEPEQIDTELCKKMVNAGLLLGIPVIEYLIIVPGEYYSLREHGLI